MNCERVNPPGEFLHENVVDHAMAREAGAHVETLRGTDLVGAVLAFCEAHGITQIFVGHSQRKGLLQRLRANPVERLIAESGRDDIKVKFTGLRPGEKLYEELLIGDNPKPTMHPRIMKAHEEFIPWAEFEARLNALEIALNVNDVGVIRLMMQQLVAGYTPSDDIVDWVYLEQEAEAKALA